MDRGKDFLKSQVNNAVMQHKTFVDNLVQHEKQAEDERFRVLCARFIPKAAAHQQMLEDYQQELGAEAGAGKKLLGKALGVARDLADAARESDFLRLVGDIVMSRQSEDTFKTFRDAGRELGIARLAQIGEHGEREHDEYAAGHVPGAVLVPLASVPAALAQFSSDATNYVICRSGARSYRACEFLVGQGLEAVNVEGGTMAWIISGRSTVAGEQPA